MDQAGEQLGKSALVACHSLSQLSGGSGWLFLGLFLFCLTAVLLLKPFPLSFAGDPTELWDSDLFKVPLFFLGVLKGILGYQPYRHPAVWTREKVH